MVGEATFSREDLDETIKIFQGLIRIDTTNPPGNEGKAAEYLKACFESNGVDCEVLGEPGRENAVAKLKGLKNKPRLLLLSHTDVVPVADVGVWTHPPFSGDIAGKWIYGRGACDDKFDAAVQAMCLIILKRQNIKLNGTLMSASVADEEVAGSGAEWLTKKVPEKVASEYVIGEGGGPCLELGSRKAFPIMLGEKGLVWFKLAAKGKAGHGSIPTLASNANVTMAEAFIRLSSLKTEVTLVEEVLQEIDTVVRGLFGDEHGTKMLDQHLNERQLDTLLDAVASKDKEVAEELRALTRMTISPNVIKGGTETNVIPGTCEARVDVRLLPGQDSNYATKIIEECLKGLEVDIRIDQYTEASMSPSDTPLYDALRTTLEELTPGCSVIPQLNTGMTDSRYWRALGSVVYGCVPASPDTRLDEVLPGIHGPDERMNIQSLEYATKFLCKVAPKVLR